MAYSIEDAYEIARESSRLEHAAYARTLTNNPAPGIVANLEDEAAAMVGLLGGTVVPDDSAVIANGSSVTCSVSVDGAAAADMLVTFTVGSDGAISLIAISTGA